MGDLTTLREVALSYGARSVEVAPDPLLQPALAAGVARRIIGDGATREHCVVLYLDGRGQLIGWQVVAVGTANGCTVHPRETWQPAYALGAVSLILAHNHPTGNPEPSAEDVAMARRFVDVGKLLGVSLLDSLVLGADRAWVSLRSRGMI